MKKEHILSSGDATRAGKAALMMVFASQVTLTLFTTGFHISAAIIVLVTFAFFQSTFPILLSAFFAVPGVIGLRILLYSLSTGGFAASWAVYWPEAIFLLSYALLMSLYCRYIELSPLRLTVFLPFILIDLSANLLEMSIRLGFAAVTSSLLLQLAAIAVIRTAVIVAVIWAFHTYGLHILSKEEIHRYHRLLLLVSELKDEMALMKKSGDQIEAVTGRAYSLYSKLRSSDTGDSETALLIAKDVHEVKKEYAMILRGIQEALKDFSDDTGMYIQEIWDMIEPGMKLLANDMGKKVTLIFHGQDNLLINHHFRFMSVFRNLIVNAIEAAGKEPVIIRLTQSRSGGTIRFELSDNCGGIPQEDLFQIFDVGFSTKIDSQTGDINRGLGLCIVRDIIELEWKGQLQVQSDNQGSIFTIDVPADLFQEEQRPGE